MSKHPWRNRGVPAQGTPMHAMAGDECLFIGGMLEFQRLGLGRPRAAIYPDPVLQSAVIQRQRSITQWLAVEGHGGEGRTALTHIKMVEGFAEAVVQDEAGPVDGYQRFDPERAAATLYAQ